MDSIHDVSQTGLLTPGSFYLSRLPICCLTAYLRLQQIVTFMRRSSPVTAAGPSRILTGFPIKLFQASAIPGKIHSVKNIKSQFLYIPP